MNASFTLKCNPLEGRGHQIIFLKRKTEDHCRPLDLEKEGCSVREQAPPPGRCVLDVMQSTQALGGRCSSTWPLNSIQCYNSMTIVIQVTPYEKFYTTRPLAVNDGKRMQDPVWYSVWFFSSNSSPSILHLVCCVWSQYKTHWSCHIIWSPPPFSWTHGAECKPLTCLHRLPLPASFRTQLGYYIFREASPDLARPFRVPLSKFPSYSELLTTASSFTVHLSLSRSLQASSEGQRGPFSL